MVFSAVKPAFYQPARKEPSPVKRLIFSSPRRMLLINRQVEPADFFCLVSGAQQAQIRKTGPGPAQKHIKFRPSTALGVAAVAANDASAHAPALRRTQAEPHSARHYGLRLRGRRPLCGGKLRLGPMSQPYLLLVNPLNRLSDSVGTRGTLHAALPYGGRAPNALQLIDNASHVNPGAQAIEASRAVASDWDGQPPALPVLVKISQIPLSS